MTDVAQSFEMHHVYRSERKIDRSVRFIVQPKAIHFEIQRHNANKSSMVIASTDTLQNLYEKAHIAVYNNVDNIDIYKINPYLSPYNDILIRKAFEMPAKMDGDYKQHIKEMYLIDNNEDIIQIPCTAKRTVDDLIRKHKKRIEPAPQYMSLTRKNDAENCRLFVLDDETLHFIHKRNKEEKQYSMFHKMKTRILGGVFV
jgi:hypothetical protein